MPISIQEDLYTLQTRHTMYQMKKDVHNQLLHLWYGEITHQNMDYLVDPAEINFSGNLYEARSDRSYSNDTLPFELPCAGYGDYRISALAVRLPCGAAALDLRVKDVQMKKGKRPVPGLPHSWDTSENPADTLDIVLEDAVEKITVILHYAVFFEEDVISRSMEIINRNPSQIRLERVFPVSLDWQEGKMDFIHFHGRHNMERMKERHPIGHEIQSISSSRGMSSHQHNPAMILAEPDCTEQSGRCWGNLLMYSGSFEGSVELDQIDHIRLILGMNPDQFSWTLEEGESFHSPEGLMSFSAQGLSKLSHNFHSVIRHHVMRGKYAQGPRPVLLNSWEACYFHFNSETILDLAESARKMGADLLVLDDGWFGKRNSDTSSLGDWTASEEKLGLPLSSLVKAVHDKGLQFGLWIEPEMISEDSDLFRTHPEWAVIIPGHKPVLSRGQMVLDMANPEVVDYLYGVLSNLIQENKIDYIKWDFNRSVTGYYSSGLPADRQPEALHRFMLGTYDLLERLISAFPDVLFEGCAGGGGRFDAGMLFYTPQIWCSDDTDAHERTKIQYGTSFFYPVCAVGSHVSAVPNHQTGRTISMETRGITAMAGTFGYELDPGKLSEEEYALIRHQIRDYKALQPLIFDGQYYRLSDPFEQGISAWSFVSPDQNTVLVQGVMDRYIPNFSTRKIRLAGLDPRGDYQVECSSWKIQPNGRFAGEGLQKPVFKGEALMKAGLPVLAPLKDDAGFQVLLRKI